MGSVSALCPPRLQGDRHAAPRRCPSSDAARPRTAGRVDAHPPDPLVFTVKSRAEELLDRGRPAQRTDGERLAQVSHRGRIDRRTKGHADKRPARTPRNRPRPPVPGLIVRRAGRVAVWRGQSSSAYSTIEAAEAAACQASNAAAAAATTMTSRLAVRIRASLESAASQATYPFILADLPIGREWPIQPHWWWPAIAAAGSPQR